MDYVRPRLDFVVECWKARTPQVLIVFAGDTQSHSQSVCVREEALTLSTCLLRSVLSCPLCYPGSRFLSLFALLYRVQCKRRQKPVLYSATLQWRNRVSCFVCSFTKDMLGELRLQIWNSAIQLSVFQHHFQSILTDPFNRDARFWIPVPAGGHINENFRWLLSKTWTQISALTWKDFVLPEILQRPCLRITFSQVVCDKI